MDFPRALSVVLQRAPFQLRPRRPVAPPVFSSPGMRADGGGSGAGRIEKATDGLQFCSTLPQTRQIAALWTACATAVVGAARTDVSVFFARPQSWRRGPAGGANGSFDPAEGWPRQIAHLARAWARLCAWRLCGGADLAGGPLAKCPDLAGGPSPPVPIPSRNHHHNSLSACRTI